MSLAPNGSSGSSPTTCGDSSTASHCSISSTGPAGTDRAAVVRRLAETASNAATRGGVEELDHNSQWMQSRRSSFIDNFDLDPVWILEVDGIVVRRVVRICFGATI